MVNSDLVYNSLKLTNFRPFIGEQLISFSKRNVTAIFADNSVGKSSLFQAFNFVFKGEVEKGGSKEANQKIVNTIAQKNRQNFCSVELDLDYHGDHYVLKRSLTASKKIRSPKGADFKEEFEITKNGASLTRKNADDLIQKLIPANLAKFYFMDAEMIKAYMETIDNVDHSRIIGDDIRRLLDLPKLEELEKDLQKVNDKYLKELTAEAKKSGKNSSILGHITTLTSQLTKIESAIEDHKLQIKTHKTTISELEQRMKNTESISALVNEKTTLTTQAEELKKRIKQKEEELRNGSKEWWKMVANNFLEKRRIKVEHEHEKLTRVRDEKEFFEHRSKIIQKKYCECCERNIDELEANKLQAKLSTVDEPDENASNIERQRSIFGAIECSLGLIEVSKELEGLEKQKIDLSGKETKIAKIKKEIGSAGAEKNAMEIAKRYSKTNRKLDERRRLLEDGKKTLKEKKENLESLEKQLEGSEGDHTAEIKAKRDLASKLETIVAKSLKHFTETIKKNTENEANRYLDSLIRDDDRFGDIKALRIEEDYRVKLLDHQDAEIFLSSSMSEIVALSLMAALHNEARLRGPVVIDDVLMRFDKGNVRAVIQNLRNLTDQVICIINPDDLLKADLGSVADAKNRILGLKKEYSLERKNMRETKIRGV